MRSHTDWFCRSNEMLEHSVDLVSVDLMILNPLLTDNCNNNWDCWIESSVSSLERFAVITPYQGPVSGYRLD